MILSKREMSEINNLYDTGLFTVPKLAKMYDVDVYIINCVLNNKLDKVKDL